MERHLPFVVCVVVSVVSTLQSSILNHILSQSGIVSVLRVKPMYFLILIGGGVEPLTRFLPYIQFMLVGLFFFSNSSFSRFSSQKQRMRDCAKPSLGDGSTKTPSQHWPSGSSSCSSRWRQLNSNLMAPCLFKELRNHDNFILLVKPCTLLGDKLKQLLWQRQETQFAFYFRSTCYHGNEAFFQRLFLVHFLFEQLSAGRCCCVEVAVNWTLQQLTGAGTCSQRAKSQESTYKVHSKKIIIIIKLLIRNVTFCVNCAKARKRNWEVSH